VRHVLFLGMGSSLYAAGVAALSLRASGIHAVAELASARLLPPPSRDLFVVAISAGGSSKETVAALERYVGRSPTVALTEAPESPIAHLADDVILLEAGREHGGVACCSFQHTGLVLRAMVARWTGLVLDLGALCERVAAATNDLLERRPDWLPLTMELLDSADGVHIIGPAERWSSVAQSALMFREGPRRQATASETGDWNHVDVYLTRATDYRALFLPGSPYDVDAMDWLRRRGSTVVSVGDAVPGVHQAIRFVGADDEEVALHTETIVAELVAASWWLAASHVEGPRS
jgi:glutamine---fructose-6-phosphate transaminase (isomerizing)